MTIDPHIPPKPRTLAFFALDGVQSLDVMGPMEVFALANDFGARYGLLLCSRDGRPIRTHAGPALGADLALADLPAAVDTLVLCGGSEAAMLAAWQDGVTLPQIKAQAGTTRRMVSICTGAFVLAATGLLDGRRASTHWRSADRFAQVFPKVRLDRDAIFVIDPPFCTSAGITAGIDLSLALVEADYGGRVALAVARELVLFLRRPGGQAQFSSALTLRADGREPLHRLALRILEDPSGRASGEGRHVPALAEAVGMSERSFLRAFRRATGMAPGAFVEEARIGKAKSLLEETRLPLDAVSHDSGYGSVDGLLRAFHKRLGITPGEYRARFRVASAGPDPTLARGADRSSMA